MVGHRWWKAGTIITRNENINYNNISELYFINDQNILSNDISNLFVDSEMTANTKVNIIDNNSTTSFSWKANTKTNNWVSYRFEVPVTVTAIQLKTRSDIVDTNGFEWQSADISWSDDGTNWIPYGNIKPEIKAMDIETKTIPVVVEDKDTYIENAWYNIIPNCNCVFALDSNSFINSSGTVIRYSNDHTRLLYTENSTPKKIYKTITSDVTVKNFTKKYDKIYTYKSFKIERKNLIFQQPVNIPDSFTLILKCKIINNTVFMSKDLNGANHGICYGPGSGVDGSNWRFSNFRTGLEYPSVQRESLGLKFIDTVVLKGDIRTQDVSVLTSYGTYKVPKTIDGYGASQYLGNRVYSVLGYASSDVSWQPDVEIIAYGIFDKEFTDSELNTVMSKIDEQFLISTKDIGADSRGNLKSISNTLLNNVFTSPSVSFINYLRPVVTKVNEINCEVSVTNLKVSGFKTISDIVYEEDAPVQTTLYLLERATGKLAGTVGSDTLGRFEFKNVDSGKDYIVVSPHKKYQFASIIKDYTLGD